MRMLFVTSSLGTGGAERALISLFEAAVDQGSDARLLVLHRARHEYPIPAIVESRVVYQDNRLARRGQVFLDLLRRQRLQAVAAELIASEIVITNQLQADLLVGRARTRRSSPLEAWVVGLQTDVENNSGRGLVGSIRLTLTRRFLKSATRIVVPSRGMVSQVAAYVGKGSAERVCIAPNPVPLAYFDGVEGPRGEHLIGAGRLVDDKGYDLLVAAMSGIDLECTVFGRGERHSELSDLASANGGRVTFPGFAEDLHSRLRTARAFCSPSRWEPFGNVMAEAAASGCVVAATPTDGAVEIASLLPDGAVHLARDHTESALRDAIRAALAENIKPQQISDSAQEVFSPGRVLESWIQGLP